MSRNRAALDKLEKQLRAVRLARWGAWVKTLSRQEIERLRALSRDELMEVVDQVVMHGRATIPTLEEKP